MTSWKSEMSALEAFLTFFDEQEFCDVKFCVGSTTIGAHKAFLQARSEVLCEWTKDWTRKEEPIVVPDLSEDIFKAVLRYIYTDEVNLTNENVFPFMYAAKIFRMGHLEALCTKYVSSSISVNNICLYMEQAMEFDAKALQEECHKIFSKQTNLVLARPEFLTLSHRALSSWLDTEEINVLEIDLFISLKCWMEEQCKKKELSSDGANMREVIGDALYKIRFPTMTMLDFANEVDIIDGLLNDTEMLQTYRKISTLKNQDINCPFSATARSKNCVTRDTIMATQSLLHQYAVLYSNVGLQNIVQTVNNWYQGHNMNRKALEILLQCCTDLKNTSSSGSSMPGNTLPPQSKQECLQIVTKWNTAANTNDMNAIMSSLQEVYEALAKLP